jgi:serine/threonine protein kinase
MPPHPEDDADRTIIGLPRAQATLGVGTRLINGTYVIEEFLARGGMGEVYRARHTDHDTQHAIKVILPDLAKDELVLQLFIREARELGRINNDVIVQYQGFLRDETGARCLIMEFVDGESLNAILQDRQLQPSEVLSLLERIGNGLAAAHELGIVHRDISPDNIIVPRGDITAAKLIDFGIAKSSERSDPTLIGTDFAGKFSFVSPEQAGLFGGIVDARSDIYSLGLVLSAAALGFGQRLNMGNSPATVVLARQTVPDLTRLPTSLRPLIEHMLQPQPENRPSSIRDVLAEARAHTDAEQPTKTRASETAPGWKGPSAVNAPPRRTDQNRNAFVARLPSVGIVTGGVALIAALVFFLLRLGPELSAPSIEQLRSELAAANSDYKCADLTYSVDPDRNVTVSGYVSTDGDLVRLRQTVGGLRGIGQVKFDVRQRVSAPCEAAALVKPFSAETRAAPTVALLTPETDRYAGEELVVQVGTPNFDSYVYVDYFTPAGSVIHLFPNEYSPIAARPILNRFVLGRPPLQGCWTFAEGTGEQVITVVASEQRLFARTRPKTENGEEYLDFLSDRLRGGSGQITAAALSFKLNQDQGQGMAARGCRAQATRDGRETAFPHRDQPRPQ